MTKIAFIDDEKNILDGLRRMLRGQRKKWDMHFYLSGSAALSEFSKENFDIVITDMRMPNMTGGELLQKVKKLSPKTHRIALSGYANDEMMLESIHATHQFISKPADQDKIVKTINRAIGLQKSLNAGGLKSAIGSIESLPSLPSVYDELMGEISSDEASIERIGEIIEGDMALSSSLLKIVNSAFFGLVRHIESPCQAASVLGLEAIKNLALSTSVFSTFQEQTGSLQNIEHLNKSAQKVGILAGRIAKSCDFTSRTRDHAQIAGMMIHLGDLVAKVFPNQINANIEESKDFPLLGSYLLGIWSMPYPVVEAVRWYQQPALSNINVLSPLAVVHASWAMLTLYTEQQLIDLETDIIDIGYLDAVVGRDTVNTWRDIANDFCDDVNSKMLERILFVDDEPKILDAYRRTLRKSFKVITAQSAKEAIQLLDSDGPFPVIVSDMQMPEMNGVELLTVVKKKYPNTIRLMLTGNSDQKTAVSAINTGDVYRFLNKPCKPEQMASAIRAALGHYRLIQAEQKLLEDTVKGSIKALVEILSIINPKTFGHASIIRNYVVKCADALNITGKWELEAAALLGQIGTVTLPESMLERALKGSPLSDDELSLYEKHPEIAAQLVNKIPRLEGISRTILYQNKGYDGSGKPDDGVAGADIPLGARLLKPVMDLVAGETAGLSSEEAWAQVQSKSKLYDPEILKVIGSIVCKKKEKVIRQINVIQLCENMLIASDVVTSTGTLLVKKGQMTSASMVARLINFSHNNLISDKVNVLMDKEK